MEHLYTIMTRNVTGFISLSSLSPMWKCCPSWTLRFLFSLCMYKRGKKESELDSSCLILGSEWTLGGSHHSYWRKQLDPSPSFLPIQPLTLWQCKCDEWVCLTSSLWFHMCRHSLFCQHKARGSTGVRMDSWGKGVQSCKYCQLRAQK